MGKLNELLAKGDTMFGKGRVSFGAKAFTANMPNLVDFPRLPSGVFAIDYALAGGIPLNTPIQFFGPWQGGKTTLATLLAKNLAKICMNPSCLKPRIACKCIRPKISKSFLCCTEGLPPDPLWYKILDFEADKEMVIGLPEYGEQGCDMVEAALKSDDCGLVIVDSVAGLIPKSELDCKYIDSQVANQARLISRLFRRVSTILVSEFRRGHLVALIYINQIRAVIGGGTYGPSEGTPGGYAAKHGYRLSLRVSQLSPDSKSGEMDKEDNIKNVMHFSASMLGPNAKQQLFIMAGKAEYKIALREFAGWKAGQSLDAASIIGIMKEHGILEKSSLSGVGYMLKGTKLNWTTLKDLETTLKTGVYKDKTGMDEIIKYMVVDLVRRKAINKIMASREQKILSIKPPEQMVPASEVAIDCTPEEEEEE